MFSDLRSRLFVIVIAALIMIAGSSCSANSLEEATIGKAVQSSNPQKIVVKEVRELSIRLNTL